MIAMNPDTVVIHCHFPKFHEQMQPFMKKLQPVGALADPSPITHHGMTLVTYPDRTRGQWLAFHYLMTPTTDSPQALALEFRLYHGAINPKSNQWPIEITFHSTILWLIPFPELWATLHHVLRALVEDPKELYDENGESRWQFRLSRVDLAVDTDLLPMGRLEDAEFLTRARHRSRYGTQQVPDEERQPEEALPVTNPEISFASGREVTGYRFGKGNLLIRIYNKWEEVSAKVSYKQDKRFFAQLWAQQGWDKTQDVWRIEIQLRREALHELVTADGNALTALTVPQALQALPGFLPYFLLDWLTLRQKTAHKNPARWPIHPIWEAIVTTASQSAPTGSRLLLPPQFNAEKLAQSLLGYLSSFALAIQVWDASFFDDLPDRLGDVLHLTREEVLDYLETAMIKKATTYHIALPGQLLPSKTKNEEAVYE